jgi:putative ABC transport system permease protein
MNTLRLALRMLRRDWHAGELRVLIAALVLAVASVGTVGFFTDRVKGALTRQANLLLGGDLLLSADRPLPDDYANEARRRGLAVVPAIKFNSMVQAAAGGATDGAPAAASPVAPSEAVLADVKAVAAGYPLRGAITLADPALPEGTTATGIPPRGVAWIDGRLAARLNVGKGAKLSVGDTTLTVGEIVLQEPEVAGGLLSMGPKLLMNLDDVPATKLLQPGNRATYRLLVAGAATDAFRDWAKARLDRGQRLESIRDLRPEVRQTLERAEKFLALAALVAVMLAAVAVALAASRYLRRHLDAAAMMRCLGAPQRQMLALFALQFLALGFTASVAGCIVALGGQQLLVALLGAMVSTDLPPPSWLPAVSAMATGLLMLMGFALPPLFALSRVPPLRVLRRDIGMPRAGGSFAYALGAVTVALLIGWQAQDVKTGAIMVGGIAGMLVGAAVLAWGMIALLRLLPQQGYSWRYGLANLRRRPLGSSLQIGALGLGLMALLLLTLVRGDLMRNWRASLPADAPNAFLINVLPDQIDGVRATLKRELGVDAQLSPMVRGRLVAINDTPLDTTRLADEGARRLGEREFNLSWTDTLPRGNRIVAGEWWKAGAGADGIGGVSLEDRIAQSLGIKLGDKLTYDIVGTRVSAKVTSLRKVDWDSFRVNFFALFSPGVLDRMPLTYISAVRAGSGSSWLTPLLREYPNVLVIDVGALLQQVQTIIEEVARAVEFVFLFTLLGGVLVLEAAIAATQDERRLDAAILRTLGASRRQLSAAQVAEFVALGGLAGLVAAAGATAIGYVLADRTFLIPFSWNPWVWVLGVAGGAIGVAVAGWLGTRATLKQSPLAVLRQLN